MLGRTLLAVIGLIIAAGVALPLLPWRVETPAYATRDAVELASGVATAACADCGHADPAAPISDGAAPICPSACPCGAALTATFADPGASAGVTIHLLVWPLPNGLPARPQPLPPKVPAI